MVILCERELVYSFARKISAQRIFEKRYNQSYKWFIQREHINFPDEIFHEVSKMFDKINVRYFSFLIPSQSINLCIGSTFKPKKM